jgi:hypothetical protein|tara:strand:- start:1138 stop:1617 length:480 start_codon:yes stop_codon:yes gene_type:complete
MSLLSKELNDYVIKYADNNPIWIATLSNGETIYQDDDRPNIEPASAWVRLKQYCEENSFHITNLKVRNRTHIEEVGSGHDGYFFCKGAGALMFSDFVVHTYNIGVLKGDKLKVQIWRLPELLPERFEERDPYQSPECLITKKGILNEQKLQAQNNGTGM